MTDRKYHGAFKVPGGKLVRADFGVTDSKLSHVTISGDFFLHPEEAVDDIMSALEGQSADASFDHLTRIVSEAVGPDVEFTGFSPQAVAHAIRRGLGHSSTWDDHVFDIIHSSPRHPVQHVALDQVIPEEVGAGRRNPTLVIWEWDAPLVVIGTFQSVSNEIDIEGLERNNMTLVRRVTGGGAMFMEAGNCITYSLIIPTSMVDGMSIEASYEFLDRWVIEALARVGVNARYVPLNDIASDKGKIGGAAQKRFSHGAMVHHVTMAYDIDADKMLEVLRIGREKLSDKGTKSANKRVDPMRSQTGMRREDIIDVFIQTFKDRYQTRDSDFTEDEIAKAEHLMETKFLTHDWVYRVP